MHKNNGGSNHVKNDSLDDLLKGRSRPRRERLRARGVRMADVLAMPPQQQSLVNWLMRRYEATLPEIAQHLDQPPDTLTPQLEALVEQGLLKAVHKGNSLHYQVRLAPKSGRQMPKNIWQVLDSSTQRANVFISYSRRNQGFVQKLHSALGATGREVWVDWENIPMAADWWEEIQLAIELADTFIFVLSPDSTASKVCRQELEEAIKHNKRLVPVVHQDVQPEAVHPQLARLNWIFLRPQDDFDAGLKGLLTAIDQDVEYVRTHTRLLVRALEWDRSDRDKSYLLRGTDLERANRYLAQGRDAAPRPTALHHQYVLASAEGESIERDLELVRQRRILSDQRRWLQLVTAASVLAVALGLTSWGLSQAAHRARKDAELAQLRALNKSARALFLSNQRFEALIEATQAGRLFQALPPSRQGVEMQVQVVSALQQALFWVQERNRLEGHAGIVWQIAYSPDGRTLASASADGTLRFWGIDGREEGLVEGFGSPLLDVQFEPKTGQIAAVDADGRLLLWDRSRKLLQNWSAHRAPTRAVQFSPDGQLIATASQDGTVKIWNKQGTLMQTLRGEGFSIQALLWTQGEQIIAGDEQGKIYLWNSAGERVATFSNHQAAVTALDIHPEEPILVSVGRDRQVKLYDLDSREMINGFLAHRGPIYNVRFTPGGEELITVGDDKLIHVWQLDETFTAALRETLVGHTGLVAALAISPDGGTIATSGGDRAVRLWELQRDNLHILRGHQGPVNAVAISPDDRLIASAGNDRTLSLWNPNGDLQQRLEGHSGPIRDVAFSPQGSQLASASSDGTVRIWQGFQTETPSSTVLRGHQGTVSGVAFHPDGQHLATVGNDNTIRFWQSDGKLLTVINRAHPGGLLSVAFSPDGKYLASTGWDHRVRIWQVDALGTAPPRLLEGHLGWVPDATFSPDGAYLATASYDNTVSLWQVSDGQLLQKFVGHEDGVQSVVFSPSGQLLLTASNDNTIRFWKTEDGTPVMTLFGHTQGVQDVALASNARFAVSASSDSKVLIWEAEGMDDIDALTHDSCRWLSDYIENNSLVDPDTKALCMAHNQMENPPSGENPHSPPRFDSSF